jgi:hypothetical protein
VVQKEERRDYGLGEQDVGLQLPWVWSSDWVAWSREEVGVNELSDFEGQTE